MLDQEYLRVGDEVLLRDEDEPRLVVSGFHPLYVGRLGGYDRKPGIYMHPQHVTVRTSDGLQRQGGIFHTLLIHASHEVAESRGERPNNLAPVRLRDLPDTPFWEGDTVRGRTSGQQLYVAAVDYSQLVVGMTVPRKLYVVRDTLAPARISGDANKDQRTSDGDFRDADELTLVARGNPWKHYHGEKTTFGSSTEEILFHLMMGWFIASAHGADGTNEARWLVTDDKADGFYITGKDSTETVRAVRLTKASDELRAEFRRLCVTGTTEPPFRLP